MDVCGKALYGCKCITLLIRNLILQGKEEALRTSFIEIDKDGSGHLDCEEMNECLQLCGFRITKHQVIALTRLLDTDKSGTVDIKEFLNALNVSA